MTHQTLFLLHAYGWLAVFEAHSLCKFSVMHHKVKSHWLLYTYEHTINTPLPFSSTASGVSLKWALQIFLVQLQ